MIAFIDLVEPKLYKHFYTSQVQENSLRIQSRTIATIIVHIATYRWRLERRDNFSIAM